MLFRKTPTRERETYVYHFDNGDRVEITPEALQAEVVGIVKERGYSDFCDALGIEPDDVGKFFVKKRHASDDAEVYNNITNSRPPVEDWQKKGIEEWKKTHPGEEPDKNWNLSMDGLMMTADQDTSVYAKQLAEKTSDGPDPMKELLYEKVEELSEKYQELYRLYFIEGYTQEEIAGMKGVSQNTISKKIRKIQKELTERCRKEISKNLAQGV